MINNAPHKPPFGARNRGAFYRAHYPHSLMLLFRPPRRMTLVARGKETEFKAAHPRPGSRDIWTSLLIKIAPLTRRG